MYTKTAREQIKQYANGNVKVLHGWVTTSLVFYWTSVMHLMIYPPMGSVVQEIEISTKGAYVQKKYSTSYFYFYPDKSPQSSALSYACYYPVTQVLKKLLFNIT